MLLIHQSPRAQDAVRTVSGAGELFVAAVVVCMILASVGDALDPMLFGEGGLEFAIFDLGGEFSVLTMRHWHLVQHLLAGAVIALGVSVLTVGATTVVKALRPADRRAIEKVPIEF
jgi:hypothetical protein